MLLLKSRLLKVNKFLTFLFVLFSLDVQQNGLNFIYDMQTCSASQFDMNLSKKILKLLQVNSFF